MLITEIASDAVIDQAYAWLCARCQDYSADDDVWNVRWKWAEIKPKLQAGLLVGTYRFSPVRRIQTEEGVLDVWAALDALVLKAMALVLTRHLQPHLSGRCTHLAGHGGSKAAVRAAATACTGTCGGAWAAAVPCRRCWGRSTCGRWTNGWQR
jgi:hypothetical protein